MVSRGRLVSEDSKVITVGDHDYTYLLKVYYAGSHYNVSGNLYTKSGFFENHPGRDCGHLRRADTKEEIEVVAKEILDDLKEYVEGYHEADGLNVSISVD